MLALTLTGSSARLLARSLASAVLILTVYGCGPSTPEPPAPSPSPPDSQAPVQVRGTERIAWDQYAPDSASLQQYQYVAYIDGTRTALAGSLCDTTSASGVYGCSAPLPPLTLGTHVLELATWISADGGVLESEKSAALSIQMIGQSTASLPGMNSPPSEEFETNDGVRLRVDVLATGLDTLTDLAVSRDGRVFVLEDPGRVRAITKEGLRDEPALELASDQPGARLCSIALHPAFDRNGFVFVAYSVQSLDEEPLLRIARYREVRETLGEGAVLLDDVPLPSSFDCSGVRVRFGPDGKLYATVPDDDAGTSAQSLGAPGGKMLRLNPDGTTPSDNPFPSPVFSLGHSGSKGFDWHPESGELWLVEQAGDGEALNVIVPGRDYAEGTRQLLNPSVGIGGIAFHSGIGIPEFEGDLFLAASRGPHIRRLRFDAARRRTVIASERLLEGRFGRIASLAVAPDGSVYFSTANRARGVDVASRDCVVRLVCIARSE